MEKYNVAFQITAALCAFLILTIPVSSSMSVSIFMPGRNNPEKTFTFNPAEKVKRIFEATSGGGYSTPDPKLKVSIIGLDPLYRVKKIYLFTCKGRGPISCSDETPVEAVNSLTGPRDSLEWIGDVAEGKSANFMTLVQMEHDDKDIWVGFWDRVDRKDVNTFESYSYEIGTLDIHTGANVDAEWVEYYLKRMDRPCSD
jgi:hypothetical protein